MPGFPTEIVGTPTNRGKAWRYEGKFEEASRPYNEHGGRYSATCESQGLRQERKVSGPFWPGLVSLAALPEWRSTAMSGVSLPV